MKCETPRNNQDSSPPDLMISGHGGLMELWSELSFSIIAWFQILTTFGETCQQFNHILHRPNLNNIALIVHSLVLSLTWGQKNCQHFNPPTTNSGDEGSHCWHCGNQGFSPWDRSRCMSPDHTERTCFKCMLVFTSAFFASCYTFFMLTCALLGPKLSNHAIQIGHHYMLHGKFWLHGETPVIIMTHPSVQYPWPGMCVVTGGECPK